MRCIATTTICAVTVACAVAARAADDESQPSKTDNGTETDRREEKRSQLLQQMKALAESTQVRYQTGDRRPQLIGSPVFRYDDQPRRFLDATMWVWTDGGRPVAFQKVEAMPNAWQFCFTSVAAELLEVTWSGSRRYQSTEPGFLTQPLADAPAVETRAAARKLQARQLIRDFSARIVNDPVNNNSEQMRLLPKPIYEYPAAVADVSHGAVFGFATNGTNPDLLVVLEARTEPGQNALRWQYAAARMTTGGVTLKHRETIVAEFDFVKPRPAGFPTWTFFATPRPQVQEPTRF